MSAASRISIVDDDALVRDALRRLLKSVGYEVAVYESAEAFLEDEEFEKADCLILDVHLPGRSGLELQTELDAARIRTPTVFITAYEDGKARQRALRYGALDFLRKPLDTERLLEVIEQALKADEE